MVHAKRGRILAFVEPAWIMRDGNNLLLAFNDGGVQRYRIANGNLAFQGRLGATWRLLNPDEIIQHLMLGTAVADWLHDRITWKVRTAAQAA
jgi:hypothetical protein